MNVDLMRRVDKYAGDVLIHLLNIGLRLKSFVWSSRVAHHSAGHAPQSIVLAKFFGMGSILQSAALMAKLKENYPSCRIIFVSFRDNARMLSLLAPIDEIISIRNSNIFLMIRDTIHCLFILRARRINFFMNLEFYSRYTTLMGYFSNSRFHVGFHTISLWHRKELLTHCIHLMNDRFLRDNFLVFFEATKVKLDEDRIVKVPVSISRHPDSSVVLKMKEDSHRKAQALRRSFGVNGDYIVLSPYTAHHLRGLRSWKKEYWRELAALLTERVKMPLVAMGGPKDRGPVHEIFGDSVYNAIGLLDLESDLVLIQQARLVISVDTALAHFADLLGVSVIVLSGPDAPTLFGVSNPRSKILYQSISCRPCTNVLEGRWSDCSNNVCLQTLLPSRVLAEVISSLNSPQFVSSQS